MSNKKHNEVAGSSKGDSAAPLVKSNELLDVSQSTEQVQIEAISIKGIEKGEVVTVSLNVAEILVKKGQAKIK